MGELIGLVAVVCIFGTPIAAIIAVHRQKIAEINARQRAEAPVASGELQEIKRQLEQLRDTSTRFDVSFDTALQRLENRMEHLERRMTQVESQATVTQGR